MQVSRKYFPDVAVGFSVRAARVVMHTVADHALIRAVATASRTLACTSTFATA
jgi:hypothetical protein